MVKYIIILCLIVSGCGFYKNSDRLQRGDTSITKTSSAYGLAKSIQAPVHTESTLGADTKMGGTTYSQDSGAGTYLLYWMGGLAILAGIGGGIFFKRYYLGAAITAAGLALILLAAYPWVLLVVAGLGLAAAIWYVFDARNRARLKLESKALAQTIDGIQEVKKQLPAAKERINIALASKQDVDDVQTLIKEIKNK